VSLIAGDRGELSHLASSESLSRFKTKEKIVETREGQRGVEHREGFHERVKHVKCIHEICSILFKVLNMFYIDFWSLPLSIIYFGFNSE
jgi:hypothetical protein